MNKLTLKLINKVTPITSNSCMVVDVNENIQATDNLILIYATLDGIIISGGVMLLEPQYKGKVVLSIKNNSDKTILLNHGDIVANYIELPYLGVVNESKASKRVQSKSSENS